MLKLSGTSWENENGIAHKLLIKDKQKHGLKL